MNNNSNGSANSSEILRGKFQITKYKSYRTYDELSYSITPFLS